MPLPAPVVALLWGSGWTVPGAVGRKKVGEQPVPLHHFTPLSESQGLALGLGLYPSGQARLSGPCQTEPVPLGLYPPSSHLPCLTYLCPASLCLLVPDVLTGLFLLTAAAAAGVHCAYYTAPVLLGPQLLLLFCSIH